MKKNIILVGFDLPFLKQLAQQIADNLNFKVVDTDNVFKLQLLDNIELPLGLDELYAEGKEKLLLNRIAEKENIVAILPIDMFVANDNNTIFVNSYVVLVASNNVRFVKNELMNPIYTDMLNQQVEDYVKKFANLTIIKNDFKLDDIIAKIKGEL